MSEKEVVGMCQKLARKFNNKNEAEDLVQEGLIICYELLKEDPETHPAKLFREAKRRMHDYLNIDVLPVSVPAHNVAKRIARDADTEFSGEMSESSVVWLKSVMSAENMSYDEDFGQSQYDHVQDYEDREFEAHMMTVAITTLNQTEWTIIRMRYFDDKTQDDVANIFKTNQSWVSRHETNALEKLRKRLL